MGFYRLLGVQKPISFGRHRVFPSPEKGGFHLIDSRLFEKPIKTKAGFKKMKIAQNLSIYPMSLT